MPLPSELTNDILTLTVQGGEVEIATNRKAGALAVKALGIRGNAAVPSETAPWPPVHSAPPCAIAA